MSKSSLKREIGSKGSPERAKKKTDKIIYEVIQPDQMENFSMSTPIKGSTSI